MKIKTVSVFVLALAFTAFLGCAKKADPNKPMEQIQKEVQTMSVTDLQEMAGAYAKDIKARKAELAKITDEMKGLSIREIFSDKAKSIKSRLGNVETRANALLERYQIYVSKLQEKGADISQVQID